MLSKIRILSPTLIKLVRFGLDTDGYMSDHACLYLQPTKKTGRGYRALRDALEKTFRRQVSLEEVLQYCLAFLNSAYAQDRLVSGHRPTPKGFYQIAEEFLTEIPIPFPPSKKVGDAIITTVEKLTKVKGADEIAGLEGQLGGLVAEALGQR